MTKHQPDFYNKKSKRYVSELCIIAVFYLIPVGQLVWNYKDVKIDRLLVFKIITQRKRENKQATNKQLIHSLIKFDIKRGEEGNKNNFSPFYDDVHL